MNKHDERRISALIKTLRKAKEQTETAGLYLTATFNASNLDATDRLLMAREHIEIALGLLSREDDGPACRVCGCTSHHACPDGCYWVEKDLCSSCAGSPAATKEQSG